MTTDGGGWQLLFQRRGGHHSTETCGNNLNEFLHNGACGDVSDLAYDKSYNADNIDTTITNFRPGEYLTIQYDDQLQADTDDAFILHTDKNIFPDSLVLENIPVNKVCNIANANCDSSDVYWKYT